MALVDLTVALCVIGWIAVVGGLLIATAGIADPTAIRRCSRCTHWMLDTRHRAPATCLRCRIHHTHPAPAELVRRA